jgi:hypothetical protein
MKRSLLDLAEVRKHVNDQCAFAVNQLREM